MGHYGDRRATPEQLRQAEMAGLIRKRKGTFSIRQLSTEFDTTVEWMTQFIQKMISNRLVGVVDGMRLDLNTELVSRAFEKVRESDLSYRSMKYPVFQPMSDCSRCGFKILGKGRHNKTARGHTKEECDLKMVEMLHRV